MRFASSSTLAKLKSGHTTLCTCFKFTLNGGTFLRVTDLDRNVLIGSELFVASPGITSTKIEDNWEFSPSNLEMHLNIDESVVTPAELRSGKFARARVQMFLVDYDDLPASLDDEDILWLKTGTVGNIITSGTKAVLEFRGFEQALKQNVVETGSRFCRATLGDNKCTANLASFTNTGTIALHTNKTVVLSYSLADGFLANGYIEITAGVYTGSRYDVATNIGDSVVLLDRPPIDLTGLSVKSVTGCDKTIDECFNKFNNVINFRGEPHVPTRDSAVAGKKGKTGSVNQSTSGGGK